VTGDGVLYQESGTGEYDGNWEFGTIYDKEYKIVS
jgi:hypothetical protein